MSSLAQLRQLQEQPWLLGKPGRVDAGAPADLQQALRKATGQQEWRWPRRRVYFISDPHADAQALRHSLLAGGALEQNKHGGLKLSRQGRKAVFVIGGDCLDKGPSNLDLLRSLAELRETGARLKLLAGNHDMRLLMGLRAFRSPRHPGTEHMFVRMGPKVVPLFAEIRQLYARKHWLREVPSLRQCRRELFPSDNWFEKFSSYAQGKISAEAIARELKRMHKKVEHFEQHCAEVGLSLREIYAAALIAADLFLHRRGEFAWFYREMQLLYRAGSFLFIHAGLDDEISQLLAQRGPGYLNRLYRKQSRHDLFEFYFGPLANTMRTKYRPVDRPLSEKGVEHAWSRGVHVVVHGHRNRLSGQRLMLRQGLLHLEGDITLDRNSRHKEGLKGEGVGLTIIEPGHRHPGRVVGLSNDYPYAKVFEPHDYLTA